VVPLEAGSDGPNRITNDEVCDATEDDSSNVAKYKKIKLREEKREREKENDKLKLFISFSS
jgi:hypothetical protein